MSLVELLCDKDDELEREDKDFYVDERHILEVFRTSDYESRKRIARYFELLDVCRHINAASKKTERNVSVIQGVDGNNIVVINDIRFKGKRSINWKEVRAYLKEFVGEFYTIASTGIPELVEIAVGKHFRENKESKHKRDGRNGWYRYDSRFALPVYDDNGEVERYNVFHASMLVRHSNDGKMYLYDVIDIKKETSNSLGD